MEETWNKESDILRTIPFFHNIRLSWISCDYHTITSVSSGIRWSDIVLGLFFVQLVSITCFKFLHIAHIACLFVMCLFCDVYLSMCNLQNNNFLWDYWFFSLTRRIRYIYKIIISSYVWAHTHTYQPILTYYFPKMPCRALLCCVWHVFVVLPLTFMHQAL